MLCQGDKPQAVPHTTELQNIQIEQLTSPLPPPSHPVHSLTTSNKVLHRTELGSGSTVALAFGTSKGLTSFPLLLLLLPT